MRILVIALIVIVLITVFATFELNMIIIVLTLFFIISSILFRVAYEKELS